ncbi:MAG: response regulator [Desulfobacterales bacterium]|nr:response regulator [Desulfobacterales bacterium]
MKEVFRADLTGKPCYAAFHNSLSPCSYCNNRKLLDENGELTGVHVWNKENPITQRWYITQDRAIKWTNGRYVRLQIATDFTDLKNMEDELRQAHKMESIGTLAGGIAHDFNNLLYMVVGNTELALEHISKGNPVYSNLEEIKSASLRAAGVVKQLLNFSHQFDQQLILIDIVIVIKDALDFLRSSIPSTIEIQKQLPDSDITILGDPIQINQIMMNLCLNASQAMQENGGVLKIIVEKIYLNEESIDNFTKLSAGNHVKITISDSGSGIAAEIHDRIFDPYFTTKGIGDGSGMGLAVVHGVVNNHDGAISVDSEPGKGTIFNIIFPVIDEKPEVKIEATDEIPHGTETILFVDDEESIADLTKQLLERLGYRVETILNSVKALELFKAKPNYFDMVITDMTMPQMTGTKLVEKVKEIRSDIPVIICTGHSSLIDEEKAKQLGIDGYIMKPVSLLKIAKTIRTVLD